MAHTTNKRTGKGRVKKPKSKKRRPTPRLPFQFVVDSLSDDLRQNREFEKRMKNIKSKNRQKRYGPRRVK